MDNTYIDWNNDTQYLRDLSKDEYNSRLREYQKIEKRAKKDNSWLRMDDGTLWQGRPETWVHMQSSYYKPRRASDIIDRSYLDVDRELDELRANLYAGGGQISGDDDYGTYSVTDFMPNLSAVQDEKGNIPYMTDPDRRSIFDNIVMYGRDDLRFADYQGEALESFTLPTGLTVYSAPREDILNTWPDLTLNYPRYYMVRNEEGKYATVPKGGYVSTGIDMYLDGAKGYKSLEDRAVERALTAADRGGLGVRNNYFDAKDYEVPSILHPIDFISSIGRASTGIGMSNCILTASQWINPDMPVGNIENLLRNPGKYNYYQVEEQDARPGTLVIASDGLALDPKFKHHAMLLTGYADKEDDNYTFTAGNNVTNTYHINVGDPLVTYSRGGRDTEGNYRQNIPLKVYVDNSEGRTHLRYFRPIGNDPQHNEIYQRYLKQKQEEQERNQRNYGGARITWAKGGQIKTVKNNNK